MLKRKIPDPLVTIVREELVAFAKRLDRPVEACVSTKDGMIVADYPANHISIRLPVMAGTILALGNSIAAECALANCLNIVLEGSDSNMILLSVPCMEESLVLMAISSRQTSLGMLHCFARECSQMITERWMEQGEPVNAGHGEAETPIAKILRGLSAKAARQRLAD